LPLAKSIARRTLKFYKGVVDQFQAEIDSFGNMRSMYAGLVDGHGRLQLYDGYVRFRDAEGKNVAEMEKPRLYQNYIAESALPNSYLKAPYYKPLGFPEGLYRVGRWPV
jgi:NAD-reducing hydrogenase large subunit